MRGTFTQSLRLIGVLAALGLLLVACDSSTATETSIVATNDSTSTTATTTTTAAPEDPTETTDPPIVNASADLDPEVVNQLAGQVTEIA